MTDLPSGPLTFLFSDIEGSTRLLQRLGARYRDVLARHAAILRGVFVDGHGHEVSTHGDSFFVVFPDASEAVGAAAEAQIRLAAEPWPAGGEVRVRIGLHSGEAVLSEGTYVGLDVHRAARIGAAAHGGQVLLSHATAELATPWLPSHLALRDVGAHRLKDVSRAERLYQLVIDPLPSDFPPPRAVQPAVDNLPVELTSFVGRGRELADARRLLSTTHLLTLVGPGGTGKTRLALQLAARVGDRFADGVHFVPLAPVTDARLVASEIGQALGLLETGHGSQPVADRLQEYLRNRELLLVIDNFEQVLDARSLLSQLLASASRLKIIVTSRAVLRVAGEHLFHVPPLRVPDPKNLPPLEELAEYEAVALFVQRAAAVRPGFALQDANAAAVAEICLRLDGLPLAIELAASRVGVLSPQAILSRLGDRLALIAAGDSDLPARQQALRSTIDWSHDLLTAPERRLFARVSVFAGGGALDEIEAVCGGGSTPLGMDVLDGLTSLADKSLLNATEDEQGEPRFGMLRTIREFALERLAASGEEAEVRDRHLTTFLRLAEDAEPHLLRVGRGLWLDRLEREHDNFRAALDWAVRRPDVPHALRLAGALWRLWQMRGYLNEGRERIGAVLALPGIEDHPRELYRALEAAGGIWHWQGDRDVTRAQYEASLRVAQRIGDKATIAEALFNLSYAYTPVAHWPDDNPQRAAELLDRAEALFDEVGDRAGLGRLYEARGVQALFRENYAVALECGLEAVARLRPLHESHYLAWALTMIAVCTARFGDHGAAREATHEALTLFAAARDLSGIAQLLDQAAALAVEEGDLPRAARLAGAAAELTASSGAELTNLTKLTKLTPDEVGETSGSSRGAEVAAAWAEGKTMTLQEAVDYALSGLARPAPANDALHRAHVGAR